MFYVYIPRSLLKRGEDMIRFCFRVQRYNIFLIYAGNRDEFLSDLVKKAIRRVMREVRYPAEVLNALGLSPVRRRKKVPKCDWF